MATGRVKECVPFVMTELLINVDWLKSQLYNLHEYTQENDIISIFNPESDRGGGGIQGMSE